VKVEEKRMDGWMDGYGNRTENRENSKIRRS
jgi:hypothetical protein